MRFLELAKVELQRGQVKKILNLEKESKETPIRLQNIYNDQRSGGHAPFLISLVINNFILHNFMLDSGDSTNVIPLRVVN